MRLKAYQLETLDKLDAFVALLAAERANLAATVAALANVPEPTRTELVSKLDDPAVSAWKKAQEQDVAVSPDPWRDLPDGHGAQVPHVCLNLPTGSGKTLIAGHAVGRILSGLDGAMTGFVLWVMPSDAIYKQTRAQLRDRGSAVRQALEVASGGRVKLAEKANDFTRADVEHGLVVMTLMLQSAGRRDKETLKVFRDSGNYATFYPDADDLTATQALLARIPNLETNDLADGTPGSVRQSLGNTLRLIRPLIILDEGHRAYSETARRTLGGMNPRFLLELTATPDREQSNILVKVGGRRLRDAEMIKLPIQLVSDERAQWRDTLKAALDKRAELEAQAREYHDRTDRFIRPILLVRVEVTGANMRGQGKLHTEDVREELINQLGVHPDWIKAQTATEKELDDTLMDETSQVRVIITKDALREGWDCPFAYVLALLSKTQAKTALTQMIGRVLRQPGAKRTGVDDLDSAWVFCSDLSVKDAVEGVRKGLDEEGMGDIKSSVRAGDDVIAEIRRAPRRDAFRGERILIPTVTHDDGRGGRRPLDFDADILGALDWDALHYDGGAALDLDAAGARRARASFDYGSAETIERHGAVVREELANAIDRPDLARRLLGLIPNPWIGIRLVDEGLAALRARGISDDEIAKGRLDLLDSMRTELEAKIDALARAVFEAKLSHGTVAFRLTGTKADWEMPQWEEIEFRTGHDFWQRNLDDHDLQRSLFVDAVKQGDLNGFERDVALYLDGSDAIAWWWRLASRGAWGVQGWRRHKVYPDFLLRLDGEGRRLMLLETKGQQLDNLDTAFKRDLMQLLEGAYTKPAPGSVDLIDDAADSIRFRMLMQDGDWRNKLWAATT
ncbi:MAG: DEAD/DEAH box helicase [Pseudomonadota bacterium]